MAIADDISVAANGDIRYTGTTANYTVIAFHRFLQDLADDAVATGDDLLDITDDTPSERSTDNIITLNSPYNIDDTLAEHLYDGSITQDSGNTIYSGLVVVGSVEDNTQLQIIQNNTVLTNYWGTGINQDAAANILLRVMIKTRTGGADIDGKRLRVQARELGDTYAEFSLTAGLGNSTAAIFTSQDLNNATDAVTISGWSSIGNVEGFQLIDVTGDGVGEEYYSQWDRGTQTINDLYEYTKWIQRRGGIETIHGMSGELFRGITHSFAYDTLASGPFVENEIIAFSDGSQGILLAHDDDTDTGNHYIQLTIGTAPSDGTTFSGVSSAATATVSGTVTARTVSAEFFGASTGSAMIGAYGIGVQALDLTASDQLFDLGNQLRVPPNNVTFSVEGLEAGEDRLLIGPASGVILRSNQMQLNGAVASGAASVAVVQTIPDDTPASGTIRIFNGDTFSRATYTSYTGSVFTTSAGVPTASDGANVFISYLDKLADSDTESFTTVFDASRSLFIRVRDGGGTPIKTFETTGTLGSAGGSTTAIRTDDA
jgi:hypothetical protein